MTELEELRERLMRPALVFETTDEDKGTRSCFGQVSLAEHGEAWPESSGRPMLGLVQLNLDELVFRPTGTEDVKFLTLFVDGSDYPDGDDNGTTWLIRTYSDVTQLTPLTAPPDAPRIAPLPLAQPTLVEDFPCFDDLEEEVSDELWDVFREQHETISGIKVGGWPYLIQSEIYWAPFNQHPARPEYVLQVDSVPEAGWQWGDGGCAYIGRGTSKGHRDVWTLDWQCF